MSLGDDPHFSVVLPSNKMLCYTIQGDHHATYNLISNRGMQMNAMFVPDSRRKAVTWISSLGFVFVRPNYHGNKTTLKLVAPGSVISINTRANFSAKNIGSIDIKNGMFNVTEAVPFEGFRYPFVRVNLEDAGISFSVMFKGEHLDLLWHSTVVQKEDSHGLIGK